MKIKPAQSKTLLPAFAALSSGIASLPAGAIELGEIEVHSQIGQPLRASIAYALGPNEQLFDYCVSLSQSRAENGMPSVRHAAIDVANGVVSLTGSRAIREPLITARVIVDCPYTAHLSREYLMFIDPPGESARPVAAPAAAAATVEEPVRQAAPTPAPARRQAVARVERESIENATRYRVQPGDTLSVIAQRIENRPVGLWDAVDLIFAANPDAFIDSDKNRLKAGSWLEIPDFGAGAPLTVAPKQPAASQAAADNTSDTAAAAKLPPAKDWTFVEDTTDNLAPPQDAASAVDTGFQSPAPDTGMRDIIADTELEGPETTSTSPNVPTARVVPPAPAAIEGRSAYTWLLWLGGAGVALILALALLGRRGREPYDAEPLDAEASRPMRRSTDVDTQKIEGIADEGYDLDDDSPTTENVALDADLELGTGLEKGVDVDVAEDFAFAATEVDFELPEEMSASPGRRSTDRLPALSVEDSSILVTEILPQADGDTDSDTVDEDFDMSVLVDATKMPHPDDVTRHDLQAVALTDADDDETLIDDSYTVSQEVDYKILEQDYEDELTATQKLNVEIAKAAEELAERIQAADEASTAALPMASVTELDVASPARAENDDLGDLDDTGINEEVTAKLGIDEETVEMDAGEKDASKAG